MMETTLYISGILTGIFFLSMLRYRTLHKNAKSENEELKSNNKVLTNQVNKFIEKQESRIRRGIYKHSTTVERNGNKVTVWWITEIEEIAKTNGKSKVKVLSLKPEDSTEVMNERRRNRILGFVGDWIPTSRIEWIITKTPEEVRTNKIDDILETE